jgi:hypothetical protein
MDDGYAQSCGSCFYGTNDKYIGAAIKMRHNSMSDPCRMELIRHDLLFFAPDGSIGGGTYARVQGARVCLPQIFYLW